MKRSLLLIVPALFLILILCGGSMLYAQGIEQDLLEEKKEYTYPVSPDKNPEEWKALGSLSDKLKASRIDDATLSRMTLDGLTKAILDYPLLINIGIYNSDKENYNCFLSQCDAFRELIGRKNGREALVQCYIELTKKLKTDEEGYRNYGDKALKVFLLEMLIANPYFAKEVDEGLLQSAITASILYNQRQENSILAATMQEIQEDVGRGAPVTPNGNAVSHFNFSWKPLYNETTKKAIHNIVFSTYTVFGEMYAANPRYNCHSYAWHNQLDSNHYWINSPSLYMGDGSYNQQHSLSMGARVYYDNPGTEMSQIDGTLIGSHSAIVANGTMVVSKWGAWGTYFHHIYNGPYSGDHTTYSYWKR